jgi:hypothetical protein
MELRFPQSLRSLGHAHPRNRAAIPSSSRLAGTAHPRLGVQRIPITAHEGRFAPCPIVGPPSGSRLTLLPSRYAYNVHYVNLDGGKLVEKGWLRVDGCGEVEGFPLPDARGVPSGAEVLRGANRSHLRSWSGRRRVRGRENGFWQRPGVCRTVQAGLADSVGDRTAARNLYPDLVGCNRDIAYIRSVAASAPATWN